MTTTKRGKRGTESKPEMKMEQDQKEEARKEGSREEKEEGVRRCMEGVISTSQHPPHTPGLCHGTLNIRRARGSSAVPGRPSPRCWRWQVLLARPPPPSPPPPPPPPAAILGSLPSLPLKAPLFLGDTSKRVLIPSFSFAWMDVLTFRFHLLFLLSPLPSSSSSSALCYSSLLCSYSSCLCSSSFCFSFLIFFVVIFFFTFISIIFCCCSLLLHIIFFFHRSSSSFFSLPSHPLAPASSVSIQSLYFFFFLFLLLPPVSC